MAEMTNKIIENKLLHILSRKMNEKVSGKNKNGRFVCDLLVRLHSRNMKWLIEPVVDGLIANLFQKAFNVIDRI